MEVTPKGRIQILKYTDEAGDEQELVVNAKMQAMVEAPGDIEFLQPGQFIAALATESNEQLFTKEISVILFGKGRVPAGRIQKAAPKLGESQNSYEVTGPIIAIGPDKDYAQYQRVEVKAAGPQAPLLLEEGFQVTVKSADLSLAPAGTPLEFEGKELKNGKFIPMKVTAKLAEPLKAADVLDRKDDEKP